MKNDETPGFAEDDENLNINPPEYSLEELLERVNSDNMHESIDTGPLTGKEII